MAMASKPNLLKTTRLCLQPFRTEDAQTLATILTNEEIAQTYMIPVFTCWEDALLLAERFRRLSAEENRVIYGIYRDETLIGFANEVSREGSAMEVGYVIHPDYKNRGYATEALWALIMGVFSMGFDTVRAGAFVENKASLRVMEKCGMIPTGETEEIDYRGRRYLCVYRAVSLGDVIQEIREMEALFDRLRQGQTEQLRQLTDYYEGGRWLRHYMLDEAGLLPKDLKRGVLSEDGVYHLLTDLEKEQACC